MLQDVQRLLGVASLAQQRGDAAAATQALEQVLALDPRNPHALNSLGMSALAAGDPARALPLFRSAAEADPREPALWLNVAKAQRLLNDNEGERTSLDAALAIDRRHFMALLRKAELHQRLGERHEAAQAWSGVSALADQTSELPPGLVETVNGGRAYLANHMRDFGEAIDAGMASARDALPALERHRFDACVDAMLGRRRIYANECHGVHFPFLPAYEFFGRSHFPWMEALEAKAGAIRRELEAAVKDGVGGLRPYVSFEAGTPENKWSPLDNSLDWGALFLWEYGVRDEAVCARFPETAAALEAVPQSDIPGRAPTAFFSLLKPRTHIPPHTGVTNLRTIIHLPLIVPEGCRFRVGGETRPWIEGQAFAFDDTIEHEAWNDSDELRAVLIFDVWNPFLSDEERRLLRLMFEASDASGLGPKQERGAGF